MSFNNHVSPTWGGLRLALPSGLLFEGRVVMLIGTHSRWRVHLTPGEDTTVLREQCERIMEALLDIEEDSGLVNSAAVSLDLGELLVEIDLAVQADDIEEGARIVDEAIKSAIAMAGGTILGGQSERLEKHAELIPA